MSAWSLVYQGFDPAQEGLREALCTLGNGYFATRGAAPEADADDVHYPGTYLAGGYNRLRSEISGRGVETEDLVNIPNWLPLALRLGKAQWLDLQHCELRSYRQELDLRQGLLTRSMCLRDQQGRQTLLTQRRLVHMSRPHLAALETTLVAENWSGPLTVRSGLDGCVVNSGVKRYRSLDGRHLEPLEAYPVSDDTLYLQVETSQSHIRVAQAARTQVFHGGRRLQPSPRLIRKPAYLAQELPVEIARDVPLTVEKTVALFTSRDHAISECGLEARQAVASPARFSELLASHALAWDLLWRRFDIDIEQADHPLGERTTTVLRLHLFHLLQSASLNTIDLDVGVPARGLHGEAYRGHIFWDELFIFPLLNLRIPEITRALLKYRYRRLDAARAGARQAGYRGAMYPWQSGSSGREESQEIHLNPLSGRWVPDHTRLQRHVNAAIAYNVWQYYQVTRDMQFLAFYGAEMILEIARFWASIATYNEQLERYEILGVTGPDEYHDGYPGAPAPGLQNHAYTNVMAVWVLCRALELLDLIPSERRRELQETLGLGHEELEGWERISRRMRLVFHGDGILSQFEGYDRLKDFDWTGYRRKYGDIQRLDRILEAEGDTPNRYKASKQADVLMLFYLFSSEELRELFERLGYPFEYETIPNNIDYYMQRTSHGSTLSRVVHSWVLARSNRAGSWRLFTEALQSDVADIQGGTTAEGIHLGAMAGIVDLVQRGYAGIETRGDVLWLNPRLPQRLASLRLRIYYRGQSLSLAITPTRLRVTAREVNAPPVKIGFKARIHEIAGGKSRGFEL